jgi:hypothetical protein
MPARIIDRRKIGMKPNRGNLVDAAMRRMFCTFPSLSQHRSFVTSTLVNRVSEVAIPKRSSHAADPRRLGAVHPVMNRRQRQQPTGLRAVFGLHCKAP